MDLTRGPKTSTLKITELLHLEDRRSLVKDLPKGRMFRLRPCVLGLRAVAKLLPRVLDKDCQHFGSQAQGAHVRVTARCRAWVNQVCKDFWLNGLAGTCVRVFTKLEADTVEVCRAWTEDDFPGNDSMCHSLPPSLGFCSVLKPCRVIAGSGRGRVCT